MLLSTPRSIPEPRKPRCLSQGDSIILVAPASPPVRLDLSALIQARFFNYGYSTTIGPHAEHRLGFLAGSDEERLSDVNEAFSSPLWRAIVCTRGGYGSGRIIHRIDFAALAKHPKIFVGSSDLTIMLNGCLLEAGITALHGPTMESLMADDTPEFSWNSLTYHLAGDHRALGSISTGCPSEHLKVEGLISGRATGRLLGGNLSVLLSSLGTRFFPSLDDSIVFLEDVGETPFRIDRNLTQLINIGAFDRVRGFALGVFERCSYRAEEVATKQSLRDVVVDRLAPLGKPIVLGLPFGHTRFNATIPVGSMATVDSIAGDLFIEELAVAKG
jgi:muramoyltetrapeptide carboxypeptidase